MRYEAPPTFCRTRLLLLESEKYVHLRKKSHTTSTCAVFALCAICPFYTSCFFPHGTTRLECNYSVPPQALDHSFCSLPCGIFPREIPNQKLFAVLPFAYPRYVCCIVVDQLTKLGTHTSGRDTGQSSRRPVRVPLFSSIVCYVADCVHRIAFVFFPTGWVHIPTTRVAMSKWET